MTNGGAITPLNNALAKKSKNEIENAQTVFASHLRSFASNVTTRPQPQRHVKIVSTFRRSHAYSRLFRRSRRLFRGSPLSCLVKAV